VRKRPWERPHSARVRFFCRELCPLVSLLVAWDTLVGGAPSDLNGDVRPCSTQRCDVLLCQDCVLLTRAGILRYFPSNGGLGIGEDGDPFRCYLAFCRLLKGSCQCCAFCVAGFLILSHVVLDSHPGLSVLPYYYVPGCSVVESRSVFEHGDPRSCAFRLSLGHLLVLLDSFGLQRLRILE
jgi:hypothetical protein